MVYFETKNPNVGYFLWALVYFMVLWNILRTYAWYISWPFRNLVAIWYIVPHFGLLCQEKSGNPDVLM
jgi:hypothetical protein